MRILRVLGVATVAGLGTFMVVMLRRDRRARPAASRARDASRSGGLGRRSVTRDVRVGPVLPPETVRDPGRRLIRLAEH